MTAHRSNRLRNCVAVLALSVTASEAPAQSCALPAPFTSSFSNQAQLDLGATPACHVSATLDSGAGRVALAYMSYRRPPGINGLRIGFRLDLSALTAWPPSDDVRIFSASARNPSPLIDGIQQILSIAVVNNSGPTLRFFAADAAVVGNGRWAWAAMPSSPTMVRIELSRNAAGSGTLRYWLNAGYEAPPSGELTGLDQAAWGGIESVALGVGGTGPGYLATNKGRPLILDLIETDDSFVFWDGFQ